MVADAHAINLARVAGAAYRPAVEVEVGVGGRYPLVVDGDKGVGDHGVEIDLVVKESYLHTIAFGVACVPPPDGLFIKVCPGPFFFSVIHGQAGVVERLQRHSQFETLAYYRVADGELHIQVARHGDVWPAARGAVIIEIVVGGHAAVVVEIVVGVVACVVFGGEEVHLVAVACVELFGYHLEGVAFGGAEH